MLFLHECYTACEPTLLVILYASITIFLRCIKCVYVHRSHRNAFSCNVLPVPPAMFQLCGGDVFMSDFKGLNIFSKCWFWSICSCVLSNCPLRGRLTLPLMYAHVIKKNQVQRHECEIIFITLGVV